MSWITCRHLTGFGFLDVKGLLTCKVLAAAGERARLRCDMPTIAIEAGADESE